MPVRLTLLALPLLVTSLVACDSGGGHPNTGRSTAPTYPLSTAANVDCPKFANIAQRITEAQAKLYTPGADTAVALTSLQTDLGALKDKAPSDVDSAIDDMVSGLRSAASLVTAPSPSAAIADQLRKLGPRLSADSQKITAYVTQACK